MGLADLRAAFPTRPLSLSPPISTWGNWAGGLVVLLLVGGFGWWASAALVPSLLNDYAVRGSAVPVNGRIDGRCRSKYGLFQDCEVTITAGQGKDGRSFSSSASYLFVEPHMGSYTVQVMADPQRPEMLTTDMGQEHLTNRSVTLAVMGLLALLGVYGSFALFRRGGQQKRLIRALSGQSLTPVPVRIGRAKEGWTVVPLEGGGQSAWQLPKKAEPFWLSPRDGVALAVTRPGGALVPLDRDLRWADFTDDERARIRAVAEPA
ncbi:hypothetical protein ACE7GA_21235 [Roseomonas sp. CCTCC AB2023176]|uniref:hypothetical protein n=1 Tax=Roseomonas sp. CCTCC AB2023176 TaxID=3342640 RepID=UPI0035E303CB